MGCMLRSEEMTMCDIYLQPETAFDVLTELGEMGCVQFKDMTPDVNAFQRKYISEIRRFGELERKLLFMREEMKKHDIYVPDMMKEPPTLPPHELNIYESLLEKWEQDIREMSEYQIKLMTNLRELSELSYVLSNIGPILGDVELRRDSIFAKSTSAGDAGLGARLVVRAGVINRAKCFKFEMMLWRVSRGNIYFRTAKEDNIFVDPITGTNVRKVAFVAICQGQQLRARMEKICAGFHTHMYPCPGTHDERVDMANKLETRLSDLDQVLKKTKYHRCKALRAVGRQWWSWEMQVKKSKAIYHTMNLFSLDITRECLIGQCWLPTREVGKIQGILEACSENAATHLISFMSKTDTNETPPTYHRTNKFTKGFQALICAYGDSQYRELNPGLYTIITFPFLFAVMFGDCGHAILLLTFVAWMLANEKKFTEQKSTNEIWNIFFGGRYILLLMGLFSFFTGFLYNDWFSQPIAIKDSFWMNQFSLSELKNNKLLTLDPAGKTGYPYVFGVDPIWGLSTNKILFDNSIKMKMSIILGIFHMLFGLFLSLFNHIYFKRYYAIILDFVPQVLFLTCLFMWLVFMMYFKWFTYGAQKGDIKLQPTCAPLILIMFIDMALMQTSTVKEMDCEAYMFPNQRTIQRALLFAALATVPIMLFGSPLYKQIAYVRAKKAGKLKEIYTHMTCIWTNILPHLPTCNCEERRDFIRAIGRRLVNSGHDPRSGAFLVQRLSIAIQRGNVASVVGTFAPGTMRGGLFDQGDEEHSFGEEMIHQGIHTIEFVLSTISHTASYLRLWALSLAHAQLSEMLWALIFNLGLHNNVTGLGAALRLYVVFAVWAMFSVCILVVMEGLSAFLHTLRLHWVEFMSKFYMGGGCVFCPFSFEHLIHGDDQEPAPKG